MRSSSAPTATATSHALWSGAPAASDIVSAVADSAMPVTAVIAIVQARRVPFVRNSFFAGETFIDRADAQRRVDAWCRQRAGMRVHGTTQLRPAEHFRVEEQPVLAPLPTSIYDVPIYATAKVHRDHHIEVAKALYSIPGT